MRQLTIIVTLLFTVSLPSLFCQEYTPMNFEAGLWHVEYFYRPGTNGDMQHYCIGDTVIDGIIYNKLFFSEIVYAYPAGVDTTIGKYVGAITENPERIVSFIPDGEQEPTIIYDFNIELGDTINGVFFSIIANSIDSVEICGKYHKRYSHYPGHTPGSLVEGIGFSNGLLGYFDPHIFPHENEVTLTCYIELNNQACDQCTTPLIIIESTNEVEVYPNPFSETINIRMPSNQIDEIRVYNSIGVLQNIDYLANQVYMGGLNSGSYILMVETVNGKTYKAIIIKE